MSRIGLIFGSFNPIHNGHIRIATQALDRGIVDIVRFVPAKQNPFKALYEVSDDHRLIMLKLATDDYPTIQYSLVEFVAKLPSTRTYDVYQFLKESVGPKNELVIMCGSDTYGEVPSWYRGKELLEEPFLIFGRDPSDISSSYIRNQIKLGRDFRNLVPKPVYEYIKSNNLYVDSTETQRAEANQ